MTPKIATDQKANLQGSIWMVSSMAAFAIEDAFVKAAAKTLPVSEVLLIFGLGGAFLFACMASLSREPLYIPDVFSPPMRIRMLFELTGRLFYIVAIALIPLSSATVILQATPLVVVAGAAMFFGEKVGWCRWAAIIVGMIGVVVIIQPGADSFSWLSILAIIGMIGFAGRDLASRAAPASLSTAILGLYGYLTIVVAGLIYAVWERKPFLLPDAKTSLMLLGAMIAGVTAYSCLMKAMRTGEVSAVTPFRYSRLIFGIFLGVIFFGEHLTLPILVGSCLIVLSGLFILGRNNRAKA